MKTIAIVLSAAAAVAILHAPHAAAQFAKVEDAIKYRKASFTVVGNHMGRLSAMAKGEKPFDAAAAQNSARIIDAVGRLPWAAGSLETLRTQLGAVGASCKGCHDKFRKD